MKDNHSINIQMFFDLKSADCTIIKIERWKNLFVIFFQIFRTMRLVK